MCTCAPSIKVAEAAKVIENTQRDLNIALMNEIALICDRLGIRTADVLAAARTKWNFLPFTPGLVGGHCIGVDPYYLTTKAEQLGYQPEVILAGRRINNRMGEYIAGKLVKMLIHADLPVKGARVGILGLTFKENVSDLRNSRVPDIIRELAQYGIQVIVHDPMSSPSEAQHEYGVSLQPLESLADLDGLILAVPHAQYMEMGVGRIAGRVKPNGILIDVKSVFPPANGPSRHPFLESLGATSIGKDFSASTQLWLAGLNSRRSDAEEGHCLDSTGARLGYEASSHGRKRDLNLYTTWSTDGGVNVIATMNSARPDGSIRIASRDAVRAMRPCPARAAHFAISIRWTAYCSG